MMDSITDIEVAALGGDPRAKYVVLYPDGSVYHFPLRAIAEAQLEMVFVYDPDDEKSNWEVEVF